jgi:hypothetical protein
VDAVTIANQMKISGRQARESTLIAMPMRAIDSSLCVVADIHDESRF